MAAASFAQVLDDVLAGVPVSTPPRTAWTAPRAADDPRAFLFARPMSPGQAWARAYPRPAAAAPVAPAPVRVEPTRPTSVTPPPAGSASPIAPAATAPRVEPSPVDAPSRPTASPVPPASASPSSGTETARPRPAAQGPDRPARPAPPRVSPIVRGRRMLTAQERRALDRLLLLGARLDEAFSAEELRREYRALALRLHPDRHAAAPASDRATLAEAFARATASYRCLQAVHAPRA